MLMRDIGIAQTVLRIPRGDTSGTLTPVIAIQSRRAGGTMSGHSEDVTESSCGSWAELNRAKHPERLRGLTDVL